MTVQDIYWETEALRDEEFSLRKRLARVVKKTAKTAELMLEHAGLVEKIRQNEVDMEELELANGTAKRRMAA